MHNISLFHILIQIIHRHTILTTISKYVFYFYLRLFFATYRLTTVYEFNFNEKAFNKNEGIYYCWHQNIIATMFFFYRNKGFSHCMVSTNDQHDFISFCAQKLGFKLIVQDSYKSSSSFLKETIEILDVNKRLYVVGDGSKGPAFRLQPSIQFLSEKSKLPLVFIESTSQWELILRQSWDQFRIPLPFSKITIRVHKPYSISDLDDSCHSCI